MKRKSENTEPLPISDIVGQVLKDFEKSDMKKLGKLFVGWSALVGHPLNKHTWPYRIRRSKLSVLVDSSNWLYEIRNNWKDEILKRVQKSVGADLIKDVSFRIGQPDSE